MHTMYCIVSLSNCSPHPHMHTHTRLETSVRMVYNSINFNMIPTVDRRAATQATERADKRLFFLNALYKRKLCTINLVERETERESAMTAAKCSDNAKDANQKAAAEIAALTNTMLRGRRWVLRGEGGGASCCFCCYCSAFILSNF